MMADSLLEARSVSKFFAVSRGAFKAPTFVKAVEDVSMEIKEGEVLCLVGESGCGKSTFGRVLLGLLKPTSGKVTYVGKDIWSMSSREFAEYRRDAQIIHQDPYDAVNPVRTIYSSLGGPLRQLKLANRRNVKEKVAELLRLVGLIPPDDFMDRFPCRLSGGQLQRISIARAIAVNPSFILADEAVSMLDASLRINVLDLLLDLRERLNLACLFITHDLAIARYFSRGGNVMIMYLGNVVESGNLDEVIRKPLHPYTEILMGVSPIPDPNIAKARPLPKLRSLEIPSAANPPTGCKFHTRCPYAEEVCAEKVPELRDTGSGREVACHLR